ncbi:leucyl/phenylalanyl-tRNA--protein transferase [Roseixanthobacter liquoris]|uniref:leucyl/phenylalanyl-tRNA--protein transferase n=1 Tax=Roseixanthobacter liquoris TaxID=3119921 RepID=UPI00372C6419
MSRPNEPIVEITPDVLLKAYACGIFPMAESADDPGLYWIEPERRGVFPLDGLKISSRLARTIRSDKFEIRIDHDFHGVIDGCAAPQEGRAKTWINARIRRLYGELFMRGRCHTVEAWRDGRLVGGLYGVRLGGAFFGESMFHIERDASKVTLVHLVARLRAGGFRLLDTQFVTSHLESLGAIEISRRQYHRQLEQALEVEGDFYFWPAALPVAGAVALQSVSHTS